MTAWPQRISNYLGQLRLYSLVDLGLLAGASHANPRETLGILLIWVSALCLLEQRHQHPYRVALPRFVGPIFMVAGLISYAHGEAVVALLAMIVYSWKDCWPWGLVSPLFRGLFNLFIVAGLTGYGTPLPWLVWALIGLRNTMGDYRDIAKDRQAGLITLPIQLGLTQSWRFAHLVSVLVTSLVWWNYTDWPVELLLIALTIELITYFLTPR